MSSSWQRCANASFSAWSSARSSRAFFSWTHEGKAELTNVYIHITYRLVLLEYCKAQKASKPFYERHPLFMDGRVQFWPNVKPVTRDSSRHPAYSGSWRPERCTVQWDSISELWDSLHSCHALPQTDPWEERSQWWATWGWSDSFEMVMLTLAVTVCVLDWCLMQFIQYITVLIINLRGTAS